MSTALQFETVLTPYGPVNDVHVLTRWPTGAPQDCRLLEESSVPTPQGWLVPLYDPEDVRRSSGKSFSLYPNGMWRNLELQSQTTVSTPLGDMPAEWLAWHENGSLKRILLRKGKLSGYWTEQDERKLATELSIALHGQSVCAKIQGLRFYVSGILESVTFWPGENIRLETPLGSLLVRHGCAFYENGNLRSCEPARPVHVPTPLGDLAAYDSTASAICGDISSLCFNEKGAVCGLVTASSTLRWLADGQQISVAPRMEKDQLTMLRTVVVPLRLTFLPEGMVQIDDSKQVLVAPAREISVGPFVALPDMRPGS